MKSIYLYILTALCISLASCDKDGITDRTNNPVPAEEARVSTLHASPDAPALSIYSNDIKIAGSASSTTNVEQGIAYNKTGFATVVNYAAVKSGPANIKAIVSQSETTANPGTTVMNANATFEPGKYYSMFLVNNLASLSPLILEDKFISDTSKIAFRFLNLMPGSSNVDVTYTFTPPGGTVVTGSGTFGQNIPFKGLVDFTTLNRGTYVFTIKLTGTATNIGTITLTGSPARTFTGVIRGIVGSTTTPPTVGVYGNDSFK